MQTEITDVEFMLIGFVALLADLLGPFGFPCIFILGLWSIMRLGKFPTKKFLGTILAEGITLGLAPGWTVFVILIFLEQKGYLPKTLAKLVKAK